MTKPESQTTRKRPTQSLKDAAAIIGHPQEFISLNDAVRLGIQRLRDPVWANPFDHLEIDIVNGHYGPWFHLFSPMNKWISGKDPQTYLCIMHPDLDPDEKGL